MDPYYSRPEVSNSDLKWLKSLLSNTYDSDPTSAFANGTLLDAMITEPEKVDYFKRTVQGEKYQYSDFEFRNAEKMKKAFFKDDFCSNMVKQCTYQKVSVRKDMPIEFDGIKFTLDMRCKWDLFCEGFDMSGDIKSTACLTQNQVEAAVDFFDYDASRALYMDIENRNNDILIFISKANHKVFKVPVKRDSEIYRRGKAKYSEMAFRWFCLFGNVNI